MKKSETKKSEEKLKEVFFVFKPQNSSIIISDKKQHTQ
jgi:hypothetical protein